MLAFLLAAQRYFASQAELAVLEKLARESVELATALPDSVEKAFALLLNSVGYGLPTAEALAVSGNAWLSFDASGICGARPRRSSSGRHHQLPL